MQEKKDRPFEVGDLVCIEGFNMEPIKQIIIDRENNCYLYTDSLSCNVSSVKYSRKRLPGSAESRAIVVALLRRARHFKQMAMESRIETSKTICAIGHATVMGDYEIAKAMLK